MVDSTVEFNGGRAMFKYEGVRFAVLPEVMENLRRQTANRLHNRHHVACFASGRRNYNPSGGYQGTLYSSKQTLESVPEMS